MRTQFVSYEYISIGLAIQRQQLVLRGQHRRVAAARHHVSRVQRCRPVSARKGKGHRHLGTDTQPAEAFNSRGLPEQSPESWSRRLRPPVPEWRSGGPEVPAPAGGPGAGELPLPPGVHDRAVDAMCSHHAGAAAAGDFGGAAGFCGVPAAGLVPGDCNCLNSNISSSLAAQETETPRVQEHGMSSKATTSGATATAASAAVQHQRDEPACG